MGNVLNLFTSTQATTSASEAERPPADLRLWTKYHVAQWLQENNFEAYTRKFLENDIDGEAVLLLNEKNMTQMGVSEMDIILLQNALADAKNLA
jgi:hypothetical protein